MKRSRFENVGAGIFTNYAGSSQFYIADNTFIGRNDPKHLIGWAGDMWTSNNGVEGQIFPPKMASYVAVKLYGPGHVVAYNYIADFHDGINVETYGNPDGSFASGPDIIDGPNTRRASLRDRRPVAIDFYNNYITNSHDNPIEADGSMHNIRIMRNMLINHPSHAFCNQPTLGDRCIGSETSPQPAGRLDTADQRRGRGALLQQHDPLGDQVAAAEHSLAQQPDARAELGAGDSERQHVHQLHLVGLQRLPRELGRRPRSSGARRPRVTADFTGRDTTRSSSRSGRVARRLACGRDRAGSPQWPSTTTSSSTCADSTRRTRPRCRNYKADEFDFRLKPASAAVDAGLALANDRRLRGRAPDSGPPRLGRPRSLRAQKSKKFKTSSVAFNRVHDLGVRISSHV